MWLNPKAPDSITIAQRVLAGIGTETGRSLIAAIDDVVRNDLWRSRQSAQGGPFASFGEFALVRQPNGLGVSDSGSFRLLRFALLENRHFGALAELIDLCAREQGRPPENLAIGEHFFHKVPTSYNAIDRILLTLKRSHRPLLEELCTQNLTPRQAAIRAGFIAPRPTTLRYGACDFEAAKRLSAKAQANLLCEVFRALSLDAQCALLNRCIEPVLGIELARQWRKKRGTDPEDE